MNCMLLINTVMKNLIYLFSFLTVFSLSAYTQEDEGKVPERMAMYIENKLDLNKTEKDKFHPLFMEYLKDLRKTSVDNREDRLVMQQKIVDLRLRYRESFKTVIGEKKANDVFFHEREFMREAIELRRERILKRGGKRNLNSLQ
jgi:hypothetical protein